MIRNWIESDKRTFLHFIDELRNEKFIKGLVIEAQITNLWKNGKFGSVFFGYTNELRKDKVEDLILSDDFLDSAKTLPAFILLCTEYGANLYPVDSSDRFDNFIKMYLGDIDDKPMPSMPIFYFKYKNKDYTPIGVAEHRDELGINMINDIFTEGVQYVRSRLWDVDNFNNFLTEIEHSEKKKGELGISDLLKNYSDNIISGNKLYKF